MTEDLRDTWRTPLWAVRLLEARLGVPFDLDVAADAENAKAPRFYTRADDALTLPWTCTAGFGNPPFSRLGEFVDRMITAHHRREDDVGFGLVTLADISTRYWATLERWGAERVRIAGRWSCESPDPTLKSDGGARMPMALWTLSHPLTVERAKMLYGGNRARR